MREKKHILRSLTALMLAAVTLLLCGCGGGKSDDGKITAGDTTPVTDGNWLMTGEWSITRADSGDETLSVSAAEDSTAWNTFFNLADDWTVSADMAAANKGDACTRLVFGDDFSNVCLAISAVPAGENLVTLRADERMSTGWRKVYESKAPVTVDRTQPINLTAKRSSGARKLELTLSQNGEVLESGKTKVLQDRLSEMLTRPGLSVYNTEATFTNFAVAAKGRPTIVDEDEEIIAGENVPTDEWLLGENAVHNIYKGGSAIIIDGDGENHAWNLVNELDDAWTLTFTTEFGKSYQDTVCSRYMFGPTADVNSDYIGVVTVSYIRNQVLLQIESKEDGAWMMIGGDPAWKTVGGRKVTVKICKYAGINRLAVFVYDGDRQVLAELSDEIPENVMKQYKHYGVMTYASQCRFSKFGFEPTADESTMPPIVERVYDKVSDITIGAAEKTNDWKLGKNSTYFHEDGKPCLVIDSKGDEFCYYKKNSLGNKWSISAKLDFGTYYSSVPGARVAFTTADTGLVALMTIKYSPSDNCIYADMQTLEDNKWSTVFKVNWTKGASSLRLEISGDNSGTVNLVIRSAFDDTVLIEKTAQLPKEAVERMKVAALATTATEVKFSDIVMNLTGPAVNISGGGGSGVMYPFTTGTVGTTSVWDTGTGMTYYTDNSLVVSSSSNIYSYNRAVEISDGFNFSTDILYGPLDAKGLSTARISMIDKFGGMAAIITVKFSENFEILVEGQYLSGSTWYNCVKDNSWHGVASNRIHINVSRADGSNNIYLTITDSAGSRVYSATLTMPQDTAKKICYLGVGVDGSKVKFSKMSLTATKTENGNEGDFGMEPIEETGKQVTSTTDWLLENGAKLYDDGSVIVNSTGSAYAKRIGVKLDESFTITTKIQFGELDKQGLSTARLALINSSRDFVALLTVKYSINYEVLVEGQYLYNNNWSNLVADNTWHKVANNIVTVTLTRAAGSNKLHLTLTDSKGVKFYDAETAALPAELAASITSFSLGVDNSEVKFSEIVTDAKKDDSDTGDVEIEETGTQVTSSTDWQLENGAKLYSDGSIIVDSSGSAYAKRIGVKLGEGFTITTKIQFGRLDSKGLSTARLGLIDSNKGFVALFTIKYSENTEVLVEGQYSKDNFWYNLVTNNSWHKVANNIITVTLTRAAGSNTLHLTLTDSKGVKFYDVETAALPAELAASIASFSLGVDNSEVKFSDIASDAKKDDSDTGNVEIEETGSQIASSPNWQTDAGVKLYSDGSIIIDSTGSAYARNVGTVLGESFTVRTKIQFGRLDSKGLSTARIGLIDSNKSFVSLFTIKYSENNEVLVEGQYTKDNVWYNLVTNNSWHKVANNVITATITRAAGSDTLHLTLTDSKGVTFYDVETAALPAELAASVTGFSLGVENSEVKFSGITANTTE